MSTLESQEQVCFAVRTFKVAQEECNSIFTRVNTSMHVVILAFSSKSRIANHLFFVLASSMFAARVVLTSPAAESHWSVDRTVSIA